MGDLVERLDFGHGEEQAASLLTAGGGLRLELAGQHALLVAVAKNVGQHGLHVFRLRAAPGKDTTRDRVGVDHLEKEGAVLLLTRDGRTAADRRQRAADEGGHDFVDQREAIALVVTEWQQRHGLLRVGRRVAILVDGGVWWQGLPFPLKLLHPSHRDHARRPIDHDGKADRFGRGKTPRVRIGAERGKLSLERHDFGQRGRAVGVGDVALLCGLHHIAAAPEIVKRIVDRDRARTVGVGELYAGVDRLPSHGLPQLLLRIPHLRSFEAAGELPDRSPGRAAAGLRAKQFVEVQCLDCVVRADAVLRGGRGELRRMVGLGGVETSLEIRRSHDRLVGINGDDKKGFSHCDFSLC